MIDETHETERRKRIDLLQMRINLQEEIDRLESQADGVLGAINDVTSKDKERPTTGRYLDDIRTVTELMEHVDSLEDQLQACNDKLVDVNNQLTALETE